MASKYKGESPEVIEEARKLLRNLKRRVRYAEKRGYVFSEEYIPSLPQYITTGTLRKLQKYTPEHQAKHSVYVSPEGVRKKGYEARLEQRKEASKKAAETRKRYYKERTTEMGTKNPPKAVDIIGITVDDLIYYFNDAIYGYMGNNWSEQLKSIKSADGNMLKKMLEDAIAKDGKEAVMQRINFNATEIYDIINAVIYESGDKYHRDARDLVINNKIQKFAVIVKGAPLTAEESAMYTEQAEQAQVYAVPE